MLRSLQTKSYVCRQGVIVPMSLAIRRLRAAPVSAFAFAAGVLCGGSAHATLSDTIHPFVGVSYNYDDNLFRQPDGAASGAQSDTSRNAYVGISLERPVARQLFTANAQISRVTFQRFDQLDYNGKNASANWLWRLGEHLDGNLGGTYAETLASFNDFHVTERNLRKQRGEYAELNWRFHPSWRARGRYSSDKSEFDLASQRFLDRTEDNTELGLDYLVSSGSSVGLQANRLKGHYPNIQNAGLLLDQGYTENDLRLKVDWHFSALTTVQLLLGHGSRTHDSFTTRDASGTTGRLVATWLPRTSLRVVGSLSREFVPFEGSIATYSLNKGASVKASWVISSKVSADAKYSRVQRDYRGLQGIPGLGNTDSSDSTRSAGVGLNYQARSNIQLGLSVFRESRNANQSVTSGFHSQGGSVFANLQF
ncbi:XrtB/PEP-CTERM-associated polysaccharide biosynthesis outer membrane protein EpsL [Duganella sp. LjRoot269]|jgi:exopolysaccharide biosynthesis operon protein EpsL|uniref:XrtB/PEP-CTERM-associated polysaccharide biosynthesis outer membrane protein EpsL n=1 Tax=Duganella sp. LjRoot269 TaxID=3342305 RepID=UPI003ECDAEC2